jgi:hypothetical protein
MALITGEHFNHDEAVMSIEIRKAHSKKLTRQELYELVWSMPMTKVGKRHPHFPLATCLDFGSKN